MYAKQAEKARVICYALAVVICSALVRLRLDVAWLRRQNSREWWLQKCIIEHKMQVI
jgi:hypothetical protein